ncbi:DUF4329 domain-containing protein [Gynurincola endophyticus]|uniref:DUF4329 domain-containing protein n=1 Tax=Gynurincola endophyticus TaxID=2479004 RepID=UPI001315A109|nr:DUF4329 domain-containing protein [Gynurincola endophyticus]
MLRKVSVRVSDAPEGTVPKADIHTHGNSWGKGTAHSDNNFSGQDKEGNRNAGIDGYVVTPDGSLKKYDHKSGKESIISTDMPSDPKDFIRKNGQGPWPYNKNEPKVDLRKEKEKRPSKPIIQLNFFE